MQSTSNNKTPLLRMDSSADRYHKPSKDSGSRKAYREGNGLRAEIGASTHTIKRPVRNTSRQAERTERKNRSLLFPRHLPLHLCRILALHGWVTMRITYLMTGTIGSGTQKLVSEMLDGPSNLVPPKRQRKDRSEAAEGGRGLASSRHNGRKAGHDGPQAR